MELAKRDLSVAFGARTFSVRAYRDGDGPSGPGWHAVIIEDRTPLSHGQGPHANAADCLAESVRFLATIVEEQTSAIASPWSAGTSGDPRAS